SALSAINQLDELENQNAIVRFILDRQGPNSGFSEYGSTDITLRSTWTALACLEFLDAMDELNSPDVIQTQGFIHFNTINILVSLGVLIYCRRKYI
ncbi:MAG: hypothetical protein ACXAD7_18435, partial [Candidatus Kariarchaeaceae archaeon]